MKETKEKDLTAKLKYEFDEFIEKVVEVMENSTSQDINPVLDHIWERIQVLQEQRCDKKGKNQQGGEFIESSQADIEKVINDGVDVNPAKLDGDTKNSNQFQGLKGQTLKSIINDLKSVCNIHGVAPNEKFNFPECGEFSECTPENTVYIDSFLYTDEDVDELVDEGKISRNYCLDCGNFISHSFSVEDMRFIFGDQCLGDISNKVVLDVGSRLGSVMYYGALFTNATKIIGIEINNHFVEIQKRILSKYPSLNSKIEIIEGDVLNLSDAIINQCDIIIMHNVFEWFSSKHENQNTWFKLRKKFNKKGLVLICSPSITESIANAGLTNFEWTSWVREIPIHKAKQLSVEYPTKELNRFQEGTLYDVDEVDQDFQDSDVDPSIYRYEVI